MIEHLGDLGRHLALLGAQLGQQRRRGVLDRRVRLEHAVAFALELRQRLERLRDRPEPRRFGLPLREELVQDGAGVLQVGDPHVILRLEKRARRLDPVQRRAHVTEPVHRRMLARVEEVEHLGHPFVVEPHFDRRRPDWRPRDLRLPKFRRRALGDRLPHPIELKYLQRPLHNPILCHRSHRSTPISGHEPEPIRVHL